MANLRQDVKNVRQAGQHITRKMADETSRSARTFADVSERNAQGGADIVRRNADAIQQAWQSGSELATRSTEQFARALGITGEEAQQARQQSSRNLETVAQSSALLAKAIQDISHECFEFARKRMAHNLDWFDALMRCRTPQELAIVQSDFVRDNLEDLLQTARRMGEVSVRMADQEVRNLTEVVDLVPGVENERQSTGKHAQRAAAHQPTSRRTSKPARRSRNPR
jgi:hypothetical protein